MGSAAAKYFAPFGEQYNEAASGTAFPGNTNFATYFHEETTGLNYASQRFYNATYGRFMNADPYKASAGPEEPGSWNKYSYTRNDPINRVDPNGTCDETTYDVKNGILQIIGINPCTPIFVNGFSISYTPQTQLQQDYESGACSLASGRPCYDADRLRRNLGMLSAESCTAAEFIDLTCGSSMAAAGMLSRFGRFAGGLGAAGWWQMAKFLGDQGEKVVGDTLGLSKNTKVLEQTSCVWQLNLVHFGSLFWPTLFADG